MLHVISNSGGETSGMLTHFVIKKYGTNGVIVNFMNTGDEHPDTYKFIEDQEDHYGFEFNWLEYEWPEAFSDAILNGRPVTYVELSNAVDSGAGFEWFYKTDVLDKIKWRQDEVKFTGVDEEMAKDFRRCMREFYALFGKTQRKLGDRHRLVNRHTANKDGLPFLKIMVYLNAIRYVKQLPSVVPNANHRFSTGNLKVKTVDSFMKSKGWKEGKDYITYLGIRKDEETRYWGNLKTNGGIKMPLFEMGITKHDVKVFWDDMPFQLGIRDRPYLGNCVDCYLKTKLKRIKAAQEYPEYYFRRMLLEKAAGDSMKRTQPAEEVLIEAQKGYEINLDEDNEYDIPCMCG